MKAFLRSFFATILAIIVIFAIVAGIAVSKMESKPKIKDHSWLVVDIYGEILEYNPPTDIMGEIMGGKPETLTRILCNLEKACVDDRIEGVIMKISANNTAGRASLQEIRGAIKKVQKAGKKVYAFSDNFDRRAYFLAAACDSIFIPPPAYVSFHGASITTTHVKRMLNKLGIKPQMHKIKDYKSAAEMIMRESMSPQSRENMEWLLEDYWDMYTEALGNDRGLTEDQIVAAMEHALFTAEEAKEFGFVDGILYGDELEEMLKLEDEEKLRWVSQGTYEKIKPEKLGLKGDKKIAIVHAQGMIGGRKSRIDPLFGVMMGHQTVIGELRRARLDDDIAAVIFRVDSGGGEGLASDLISHEVEVLASVKPVVVSMVDVAGSGGYYIAYTGTKIVADPMTITGSIGSISGKFNVSGFFDKLGITHDFATKGPKALMYSELRDFTKEEWDRHVENHWDGFNAWLKDVAEHRGMTFEEAEKLAHGRVWTGRQAKENGLIDEVGGLDTAIEMAKELAEIPADEKVTLLHYPKKKELIEVLLSGGDLKAAAQYVVYRYIRDDLAETWRMVTQEPLHMIDETVVE